MLQALCDAGQQQMHRPLWWGDIGGTGRSRSFHARDRSRHGGMVSTVNRKEQAADQTAARLRLTKMISDAATNNITIDSNHVELTGTVQECRSDIFRLNRNPIVVCKDVHDEHSLVTRQFAGQAYPQSRMVLASNVRANRPKTKDRINGKST
jgi:hypothetical protein